jgi:hypothetical protein
MMIKLLRIVVIATLLAFCTNSLPLAGTTTTHGYFYKPSYGEKGPVAYSLYNATLDVTDTFLYSMQGIFALVTNWAVEDDMVVLVTATPTYVDSDTFTVSGDYTSRLTTNKIIQAQVAAGMVYSTVASSSFGGGVTTVNLNDAVLTNPITRVYVVATRDGLWPNGPGYVVARDYGVPGQTTLDAALAFISSSTRTLVLSRGTWSITADTTIPANINLKVEKGAVLDVATKTLTINGSLDAGLYQVFSYTGTGRVVFGPGVVSEVCPQWWGAIASDLTFDQTPMFDAAITALPATGGTVEYPPGEYAVNILLNKSGVRLQGCGSSQVITDTVTNRLVPWDVSKPVIQIANDTKDLKGSELNHIEVYSPGPNGAGTIGTKLAGGAYGGSYNSISVLGNFSQYNMLWYGGDTYCVSWNTFTDLKLMTNNGVSNIATLATIYGNTWVTACGIVNFGISGPDTGTGHAILNDSGVIQLSSGWVQCQGSHGIKMAKSYATKPVIYASDVRVESPAGNDVLLEVYNNERRPSSFIQGSIPISGKMKNLDGTEFAMNGIAIFVQYHSILTYPFIDGSVAFVDAGEIVDSVRMGVSSDNLLIINERTKGKTEITTDADIHLYANGGRDYTNYGATGVTSHGRLVSGQLKLNEIAIGNADNGCLFVDAADHILKFKDSRAAVHSLY